MITKLRKFLKYDPNTDIKFNHENDPIFIYASRTREVIEAMVEAVRLVERLNITLQGHEEGRWTRECLANLRAKLDQ